MTPADIPRGRQNAPAASRKLRKREKSLRQTCGTSASAKNRSGGLAEPPQAPGTLSTLSRNSRERPRTTVWTAFTQAYAAFDEAYVQQRKWAQTEELEDLDKALSAFLQAIKAMISSPNAEKAQRAKYLQNIRDKYTLDPSAEYMKETTAIQQMVQEMDRNYQCELALNATGINDFYADLKTKNEAFLAKMDERTEAQSYQQKGIVRETRTQAEQAYKDLVKLINAMAIVEVPADFYWSDAINSLNAEIDHYKQILARKGVSTGSGDSEVEGPSGGGSVLGGYDKD